MKEIFQSKGGRIFILVIILAGLISFRLLSDSDIGTHLKSGKWIIENHSVPGKDTFTYTSTNNDYIDNYWLFQGFAFTIYRVTGYTGLSILVFLLSMLLVYLIALRLKRAGVPYIIASIVFLIGFLCIESRITLRPEMFTFLFLSLILLVLDRYFLEKPKNLFLLPLIMLFWCNVHGLFILGYLVIGAYFISLCFRDKRIDYYFLIWFGVSILTCLVNPYTYKLLINTFLLNTRLSASNVFHQHIRELTSFTGLDHYVLSDYLFILLFSLTLLLFIITWRKRKIHDGILVLVFFYLAWVSIRNIGLFAVVTIPILGISLKDFWTRRKDWLINRVGARLFKMISNILYTLLIILILGLGMRVYTNTYYYENSSYNKTGLGLDDHHLPIKAIAYLNENHLDGKIINSLSLGSWLDWGLPQPVFIDGRLEVIGESLYNEVMNSWSGGLGDLIQKYRPSMIIYNYDQYFSWTLQLSMMPDWRLIYIDGLTAIFAKKEYREDIPAFQLSLLLPRFGCDTLTGDEEENILNLKSHGHYGWFEGFYKQPDYTVSELTNLASFCLQMNNKQNAKWLFLEILHRTNGGQHQVYYALADIYSFRNEKGKAAICYKRILSFDPGNSIAKTSLENISSEQISSKANGNNDSKDKDAVTSFNEGNDKYQKGDINGAIASYNKAIELNPSYFKAYNNLGIVKASGLKHYADALEDFNRAIEIKPDYSDAYMGRGSCFFAMKETEKACRDWQKSLSLGNSQVGRLIETYCK